MAQRVTLAVPDPANPGQDVNIGTASNPIAISGGGGSVSNPGVVQVTNGAVSVSDGQSNNSSLLSGVNSSGTVGTTTVRVFPMTFNGTTWDRSRKPNQTSRIVSAAATTNATLAKASAGDLFRVTGFNANAAARYLKIYNKATAPTVGTDTPVWTEYLPAQARFELSFPKGYYLSAGIAYALTTGSADADSGALTAADILALNVAYA